MVHQRCAAYWAQLHLSSRITKFPRHCPKQRTPFIAFLWPWKTYKWTISGLLCLIIYIQSLISKKRPAGAPMRQPQMTCFCATFTKPRPFHNCSNGCRGFSPLPIHQRINICICVITRGNLLFLPALASWLIRPCGVRIFLRANLRIYSCSYWKIKIVPD